jgi:Na+/proline symporter
MLGVWALFFNKNKTAEDFYVSGRNMVVGISAYLSWRLTLGVGSQLV